MPTQAPTDTEAFLIFLADEAKNGGATKSPEELLQTWRAEHAGAIGMVDSLPAGTLGEA